MSTLISTHNQVSSQTGDTLRSKYSFESFAEQYGVSIKQYHANNAIFNIELYLADFSLAGQCR